MRSKVVIITILLAIFGSIFSFELDDSNVSAEIIRGPIYIDSNNEFKAENGVSGGTGAVSDPYIISGFTINASGAHGIDIRNTNVHFVIDDVRIRSGDNTFFGISLKNIRFGEVRNSWVDTNYHGIHLEDTKEIRLENNSVTINTEGVVLINSTKISVIDNNISRNYNNGVSLESSGNNIIKENEITSNVQTGIQIRSSSEYNEISQNEVLQNRGDGIALDASSSNLLAYNSIMSNFQHGLVLRSSSNDNVISDNDIHKNIWKGISIRSSANILIDYNHITSNNLDGIEIDQSFNNKLLGNNISKNLGNGISFKTGSDNNQIEENYILMNNRSGAYLSASSNNSFRSNIVFNNIEQGINIDSGSNDNKLNNNVISYNGNGVYIYSSDGNRIVHNNFINNSYHTLVVASSNTWNETYPSGGNYWSGYLGKDHFQGADQDEGGADGIFDDYFFINPTNRDNYPFVNPYGKKILSAPRNLSAKTGSSFALLSWELPIITGEFPITNYIIYRNTKGGIERILAQPDSSLSYNDTEVENGVTYYYKVRAKSSVGEGLISNEVTARPGRAPSAPRFYRVEPGDSYVNLSWEPPGISGGSEVTKYRIYRLSKADDKTEIIEVGNVTNYNDTTATIGVLYNYKLTAENEFGESPFSNEVVVSPVLTQNHLPTATVNADLDSGSPPLTVTFMGLGADPDGTIAAYKWDFDDGTISTDQNPVHTFTALGTYQVTLTVTDDKGAEGIGEILISVSEGDEIIDDSRRASKDEEETEGIAKYRIPIIAGGSAGMAIIVLIAVFLLLKARKEEIPVEKKMAKREVKTVKKQMRLKRKGVVTTLEEEDEGEKEAKEPSVAPPADIEEPTDDEFVDMLDQKLVMGEITEEEYKDLIAEQKQEKKLNSNR